MDKWKWFEDLKLTTLNFKEKTMKRSLKSSKHWLWEIADLKSVRKVFGIWTLAACLVALSVAMSGSAWAATDCNAVTEIPAAECQELLSLYNSTNGANWINKTGWNQTNTPCSWDGVTCSVGHVIYIKLSNNGLNGTIPDFKLPKLELLSLFNTPPLSGISNQLSGSIPNFSNSPNLDSIYINGNQLTGSIPKFNLLLLSRLNLKDNLLSGIIPNLNFATFSTLSLSNNCGLIAYDSAQETLLNSKNATWQQPNPACPVPKVAFNISKTGNGSVSSSPAGISCGSDCTEDYALNSSVTLTATADPGYVFKSWGGACSGTSSAVNITMDAAKNCTAAFDVIVYPNISVTPATYDFEDLNVGSSFTPTQTFTVSNNGAGSLNIGNLTITNSDDFTVSGCSGKTLVPSQTCEIQVTPSPKSVGVKTATISIPSDDPDTSNLTVSVKVNGVSIQKPLIPLSSDGMGQGSTVTPSVLKSSKVTQTDVMSCGKWVPVGFGVKDPYGYTDARVLAIAYDKKNNWLYVGGSFKKATDKNGDQVVNGIAKWNPATETWSPLGSGVSGAAGSDFYVNSLTVDNSGNLYAGGFFTHAGGQLVNRIAKWNGSAWSKLGDGLSAEVASLAIHPTTGVLYAAGKFPTTTPDIFNIVAKYENNAWKTVGAELTGVGYVHSITFDKNGQLYVSGKFTIYLNGNTNMPFSDVAKLVTEGIYSWWAPLADSVGKTWDHGYSFGALSITTDGKGNLYTGGDFRISNIISPYPTVASKIAMNNQTKWTGLTQYGLDYLVAALAVDGENNLYAGGNFSRTEDSPYKEVKRVAKWNGTQWNQLGDGLTGYNGSIVQSLAFDGDSNLYAGGTFDLPGGSNIARWSDCVKPCPEPATIESVGTGSWDKATTWWDATLKQNRIPNSNDVVLVKKGHTVTGVYNTTQTVKGLCNYGTIQSGSKVVETNCRKVCDRWRFGICWDWDRVCDHPTYSSLNLTTSSFMNNYGQIQRISGSVSDAIALKTSGVFSNYPGAKLLSTGGSISVSAKQIANYGAYGSLGVAEITAGTVSTIATQDFSNKGKISGSSTVKVSGLPLYNNGSIAAKTVYLDPQFLSILEDAKIEADEVIIVGGDDAVLDLSGLKEGTIITNKLTIAVGKGGSVDLTGTPANAIQATEVKIFADNIVLEEGKQLTDSVNTSNVTVQPAKILYDVSIIPPGNLAGKMGEVLPVTVAIANTGPKVDTYTISVTSKLGWKVSGVSSAMTVETHEQGELAFNIALPMIGDNEQGEDTLTVTATSQSDPTVSHSLEVKVSAAKQIFETTIDESTGKLIAIDESGNMIDVEQLIKENEEKAQTETLVDENGNPMSGVTIQIGDQAVVTDTNGNWKMPELPAGNYNITMSKDGKVLSSSEFTVGSDGTIVTPEPPKPVTPGIFTVDDTGIVKIDWLYDGGKYQGEFGIFNLAGMETLTPGSPEFIAEAAKRVLSDSEQGYLAFSDLSEGARFSGLLGGEVKDWNAGPYKGVKSFDMTPGTQFATILVPNSTFASLAQNPLTEDPNKRPLFSLVSSNPAYGMYLGQMADVNGMGKAYSYEDKDAATSDKDFNDLIVMITGATADLPSIDDLKSPVVTRAKRDGTDWRTSELGRLILEHVESPAATEDSLSMTVTLNIPTTLLVYDSTGKFIGKAGGTIAGADFELKADGTQTVTLPNPAGNYRVAIQGAATAQSTLTVKTYQGGAEISSAGIPVDIAPHQILTTTISADGHPPVVAPINAATSYDFNGDGVTDNADVSMLVRHWNSCKGQQKYDAFFDVNDDGCITVADIMMVLNAKTVK